MSELQCLLDEGHIDTVVAVTMGGCNSTDGVIQPGKILKCILFFVNFSLHCIYVTIPL